MAIGQELDNTRVHDLAVEEVKSCGTFSHFTDEQALVVIETLKLFCKISFDIYKNEVEKL